MSRLPNAETLAEVRAEALDWFWREVSYGPAAYVVAELRDVVPLDANLSTASVLEIQGWASRMSKSAEAAHTGQRGEYDESVGALEGIWELAEMDGALDMWAQHLDDEAGAA